jgi:hypothetical protein
MGMVRVKAKNVTGSTSLVDAWAQNTVKTLPTTAVLFGYSSSAAADAAAGTGARTIRVTLIDGSGNLVTEDVTLNGQTKVNSSFLTCLRVLDMEVLTAGSGGVSAGDIYAYDATDTVTAGVPQTATKIFGKITTGQTESMGGHYTIPKGYIGKIEQFTGCYPDITATAKYGYVDLQYKPYLGTLWKRYAVLGVGAGAGAISYSEKIPENIPELTDLRIQYRQSAACEVFAIAEITLAVK